MPNAGVDEENVIFDFPLDDDMIRDIYAMHAAGKKNLAKGYDVTGYFLLCMSRLVRANMENTDQSSSRTSYIKKACRFIEDHYEDNISVTDIAFHVGLDRTYLYRIFQEYKSCSPSRYLVNYRLDMASQMLEKKDVSISEIGVSVGFHDASHFYKSFSKKFGMTPKRYREEKYKA